MTPAALVLAAAAAVADGPSRIAAPGAAEPHPSFVVPALHDLALLTVIRKVETFLYPDPFAYSRHYAARYEEAFTLPPKFDGSQPFMRWDGDPLLINVVGHGLLGSELYLRARQCHFGVLGSLGIAAVASTLWEYGFEANGVRPSAQDLVYTPLMGLALGEARFVAHRLAGKLDAPTARGVVRAFVDPFGELERFAGTEC